MNKTYCVITLTLALTAMRLVAQQTISISGRLLDAQGHPMAGVSVSVENFSDDTVSECCGPFRIVTTRSDGSFAFELPPALWGLTADPKPPLNSTRTRVDARNGSVGGSS